MQSRTANVVAMTRTLFLMRHAKAEAHDARSDFERRLAPRGWRQAKDSGLVLADRGIQLVLCSSSERTRQTYEALNLKTPDGEPVPVQYMEALYLGSADLIRQRISEIEDEVAALLVIGHSPGIPTLAAELAWATKPREADQIQCWFPTAAHSEFEIDTSWAKLNDSDGNAQLADVRRPGQAESTN